MELQLIEIRFTNAIHLYKIKLMYVIGRLYGEGTWEIYTSLNSDKTGGYFFDSGTFTTLGTTALKLVNDSGIYVADVTLDGDGDLMLSPVISGYGNI